jgi:hypothetical protein
MRERILESRRPARWIAGAISSRSRFLRPAFVTVRIDDA